MISYPEFMRVRERVQALMQERGWKGAELARRVGEHRNWVNSRLNGSVSIAADDLIRFARALGVPAMALLDEADVAVDRPAQADRMALDWGRPVVSETEAAYSTDSAEDDVELSLLKSLADLNDRIRVLIELRERRRRGVVSYSSPAGLATNKIG